MPGRESYARDLVRIEQKLDENESELRGDVRFLNHRIADLEMEVEKLKNR
ncbi:hypothetical protein [Paenibacillus macerans]|nr:hypothetical protein [Paenibacillus macerans]MBS5914570.1 hypothetical protein [Paenibacillus macerans]